MAQNKYPIFIPSKGRHDTRLTVKSFDEIGIPYTVFVEAQEFDSYAAVIDPSRLHVLPHSNKGLVVTRNYIWDYAQSINTPHFWTFDDNIDGFYRFNRGKRIKMSDGAFLSAIEDFHERYENLAISGMHYYMFGVTELTRCIDKPLLFNTRVYSNMLIRTDIPYRNEGFYNDDTDLCLRVLKDGWCTALFYAFLIRKEPTMTISGGMTPHYQGDGRFKMAYELYQKHPDVVTITRKWGRWQHQVDYRPFRNNRLIRKPGVEIPEGPNEYGMKLVKVA